MANELLAAALSPEPLVGVMPEDDKKELENATSFSGEYLAQLQNTTVYAGLSGDDPNQVVNYTDAINEELYGTPSHETALANNKKASETARVTLSEKLKNFTIYDAIGKLPFSPLFQHKKGLVAATKQKLETGKYPVTSFAGLSLRFGELVGALDVTKEQQKQLVEHYEKEFKRGQTIPATIFDGVTMLPAYMIEFATGGAAAKAIGLPYKGVKGAFAASSVRTLIQPHRVASSFIDQKAKGESPAMAVFKAYGDVYIENLSEAAGEGFIPLVKKLPLGSKFVGALTRIGKKLHVPKSEVLSRISTKAGWNGLVSEWGEERLGTELRAIFDIEDFGTGPGSSIPDRMAAGFLADMTVNNQLAEAGVLSFPFATKMLASKIIGLEPIEIEPPPISEAVDTSGLPPVAEPTVKPSPAAAKPSKATEPPITPTEGKQPWEMTREEFDKTPQDFVVETQFDGKELIGHKATEVVSHTPKGDVKVQRMIRVAELGSTGMASNSARLDAVRDATHEDLIKAAIKEGKSIPAEVLAEYPDLPPAPAKPGPEGGVADSRTLEQLPEGSPQTLYRRLSHPFNSVKEKYDSLLKGAAHKDPVIRKRNRSQEMFNQYMGFTPHDYDLAESYNIKIPTFEQFQKDVQSQAKQPPAPQAKAEGGEAADAYLKQWEDDIVDEVKREGGYTKSGGIEPTYFVPPNIKEQLKQAGKTPREYAKDFVQQHKAEILEGYKKDLERKAKRKQPPAPQAKGKKVTGAEKESLLDIGIPRDEASTTSPAEAKKKLNKKVPPEKTTPPAVAKEFKGKQPQLTEESKNAPTILENYWREYDEREFEINVQTTKNQERIAKALGKKTYLPKADVDVKDTSMAMMLYIDLKEHPEGHKFAKELTGNNKTVYEKSQNLPVNVQKIADKIIEQNRQAGELAVEQGVIKEARENYIAHLWERTPQREGFFTKFRQKTQRSKQRKLEGGIAEGLSKGMKLRVKDVTLASQIAQSQVNQANVGKKLLKIGKEWGLISHNQESEDWVKVEHPGFTTWRYRGTLGLGEPGDIKKGDWVRAADRDNLGKVTEIKGDTATVHFVNRQKGTEANIDLPIEKLEVVQPKGAAFFITDEGTVMEKVPVYAEPELGKKLNNVFSPSVLYKIPGVETVTRYNAILKSTLLYTSLFHHQAFLRSYAFGSHGLNPVQAYEKGKEAIMNMTPEIRLLVRNGLTLGRIQDFDPRMLEGEDTIFGKAMALTEPTEKANEWLQNQRRRQERFLFNKLGPYLKTQAALLEFKAGMERNRAALERGTMTADDVAFAAATLMNNDFGGLHLGRMGRNNTVQHLMRLMLLAPDWTESNVRSMVSAFRAGEEGYMHRMFWGRIAVKALGATVLFNLLMSAFDDEDFAERYKRAWEEGKLRWLDVDITPIYKSLGGTSDSRKYFSLIGHFRDPVKFVARPGASLKHKGSVVSRIMFDFASGQDWAGRQFTTVGELTGLQEDGEMAGRLVKWGRGKAQFLEPSQYPSWFAYEGRQIMPIPIQNIAAFLSGEMEAFDAITKSMGLMTSTTFPDKSKGRGRRKSARR